MAAETFRWDISVTVSRWADSAAFEAGADPDSMDTYAGNQLLNNGIARLGSLLVGAGGTAFNAANSRIGVGNGTASVSAAQTDLQGASKYFKLVDSVSWSGSTGSWAATFGASDANFSWEEWGIDNGSTSGATVAGPLLNRKAVSMGTKSSGSTWTMTVNVTIS